MLTITQEIKRLEALLNGETVEGLKLGDPGLNHDWVIMRIAALRELRQVPDPLDSFIEELLDIARENPIDDARIIIRDRLVKDAERVIKQSC